MSSKDFIIEKYTNFSALNPRIVSAKEILGCNISFTEVTLADADFILSLRTDEKKNKYLSKTENDIKKQEEWITDYLQNKREAYFIIRDKEHQRIGTVRLYDNIGTSFCWGSWILIDGCSKFAAIESALMIYNYAIYLGFDRAHIDVRNNNTSVIKFHENFGAKLIKKDEIDSFYSIDRDSINKSLNRFKRFLPDGILILR